MKTLLLTVFATLAAQQPPAVTLVVTDHLQIATSVSEPAVAPGAAFSLVFEITPRPRMHVYAPGAKGYKIIGLTLEPNPLIVVKPLQYPPSQTYLFQPLNERVPVFEQPFTLKQPLVVGDTPAQRAQLAKTSTLTIKGTVNYQACDDKLCFLPKSVPVTYSVAVKAQTALAPVSAQAPADIVTDVRAAIAAKDLARADMLVQRYRAAQKETPEMIEALSWLARGAYAAGQLDQAVLYSVKTNDLAVAALRTRRLSDDVHLQTALGAAIETEALVRNARGDRQSAVYFLQRALEQYSGSPIHKRLAKNLNLLSLEGQPAPALDASEIIGPPVPTIAQLKGSVVLLFFWAHWCPDCKMEGPIIAKLLTQYRARGLRLIAPTTRFGYIVEGTSAPADAELRHIIEVRDQYYGFLRNQPVPVTLANHQRYGVSSTPTLALVDRQGIVRVYHPGLMTEAELDAAIRKLL